MAQQLERRSFLARVIGGGAALLAAAGTSASVRPPRRGLCSDSDSGRRADPAYRWYSDRDTGLGADPVRPPPLGLTDRDAGPNNDQRTMPRIGRCPAKPRRR